MTRKRRAKSPAVIDACCLIDLLASGRMEAILAAAGYDWQLPDAVTDEVRYIRQRDPTLPDSYVNTPVELAAHFQSGRLTACRPADSNEANLFLHYAAMFRSDGEATCLALARSRNWLVASDDRKAIRVAQQAGVAVISCPALVKMWADADSPAAADLVHVLSEIQALARFVPSPTMAESRWWMRIIGA